MITSMLYESTMLKVVTGYNREGFRSNYSAILSLSYDQSKEVNKQSNL